jgi:hypothetical protein
MPEYRLQREVLILGVWRRWLAVESSFLRCWQGCSGFYLAKQKKYRKVLNGGFMVVFLKLNKKADFKT